jgi:hypothetical protein
MVYAVRTNLPVRSTVPIKKSRIQGEHSKSVEQLLKNHNIIVKRDSHGNPMVIVKERDDQ